MWHKIPRWLWLGAFFLAWNAGFLNIAIFSSTTILGVSHVTGQFTLFTFALSSEEGTGIVFHSGIILFFFLGAILSGIWVRDEHFKIGRRYGLALLSESFFLILAFFLIHVSVHWGVFLVAAALGLQNAMVSTFSGSIVRTTHMTGILSDLGASFGNWIGGRNPHWRSIRMQFTLLSGFFVGGVSGFYGSKLVGFDFLIVSAALTLMLGLYYLIFIRKKPSDTDIRRPLIGGEGN